LLLCGHARAGGADFSAGTAILALGRVDDVDAVTFGDGVLGAFSFTRTAGNAIGSNLISHIFSFRFQLNEGKDSTRIVRCQRQRGAKCHLLRIENVIHHN